MADSTETLYTVGLALGAMVAWLLALTGWVLATVAREPDGDGSVTLYAGVAVVFAVAGLVLLGLAGRRVLRGLRERHE